MAFTERLAILISSNGSAAAADIRKVGKASKDADRDVSKLSDGMTRLGKGAVAGVGIGMVVSKLNDATDSAMRLNTQVKTSERVFGGASTEIDRYARTSATALGMSEQVFRLNANRLGAMTTNLGYTKKEAAGLSAEMLKVAADMGAAFGESPERAIEAIGAAMRGERDPIEAFGISLKQVDIDAKVSALSLDTSTAAAKKHADAVASVALIQEQAAKTAGAFADGVADGSQAAAVAAAKWENSMAKVGKALIPIKKGIADLASDAADVFTGYNDQWSTYRDNTVDTLKLINDEGKAREYLGKIATAATKADREAADATNFLGGALNAQAPTFRAHAQALDETVTQSRNYMQAVLDKAKAEGISYAEAKKLVDAQGEVNDANAEGTETTEDYADSLKDLNGALDDAKKKFGDYWDALDDGLTMPGDFDQALRDMVASVKENGTGLDWMRNKINLTSEAGIKNRDAFREMRDEIVRNSTALLESEGPGAAKAKFDELTKVMRDNLLPMFGYNTQAVDGLMRQLGLTAGDWEVNVKTSGIKEADAAVTALLGKIGGSAIAGILNIRPELKPFGNPLARASGGPAGGWTMVGERGKELVDLPKGSYVHSSGSTQAMFAKLREQVDYDRRYGAGMSLTSGSFDALGYGLEGGVRAGSEAERRYQAERSGRESQLAALQAREADEWKAAFSFAGGGKQTGGGGQTLTLVDINRNWLMDLVADGAGMY